MKKVLLVHPEDSRTKFDWKGIIENECLDLECITTVLKERNYDVTIFDVQIEKESFKHFIKDKEFDVCYISGRIMQENFMLEYAKDFKDKFGGLVIVGGIHAELNYERFFKDYIDYVLCGSNYYDLVDIIEGNNLENIKNLCVRKDDEWLINERGSVDIKNQPLPDRTYFYNHKDNYNYLDLKHIAWIKSAYSCPYRCSFCIRNKMNNGSYTRRDVEEFVDEIESIEVDNIYIADDDFLFDRDYLIRFINLIKERDIKKNYICYGRSDFITNNEDIIKGMKEIGLYYVMVGLEDIRDSKLSSYNKQNSFKNNDKCIEVCHKHGLKVMAMFILGLDFKKEDFNNLYKWIKKKDLKHVAVSIYTPEMGLASYEKYKDRIISDNPSHYDYLHLVVKPDYLSVRRYYYYYYKLLIKLFLKGQRDGVYDFIDYKDYIKTFLKIMIKGKREGDDA